MFLERPSWAFYFPALLLESREKVAWGGLGVGGDDLK
jgi:hypothetical protein